jgi:diacylglycerol kinase family enzyme
MTNPDNYGWQAVYVRATLETDDLLITGRIYEALSAIEQRRLSPVERNSDEDCALNNAEVGMKALITERTDRFVWNAAPGHWTIRL